MRTWLFIPLFFSMMSCYALKIITIQQPLVDIEPYMATNDAPVLHDSKSEEGESDDFRLPVKSQLSPGVVARQTTPSIAFSYPIFVVGDDERSRTWLQKNSKTLREKHALGLVTNIKSKEALATLQALSGLPLQPVNVDELASLLKVSHYPFLFDAEARVIWQ